MKKNAKLSFDEIAVKRLSKYPGKPTVIFLHDSLGCIDLWKDFPSKLADLIHYNVLIYDRQGHGKSGNLNNSKRGPDYLEQEADILNQLIQYWNLEQVLLFGHSDGGSIALITAAKYPDRIKGLIIEAAHIFVEELTIKGIQDAIDLYQYSQLKVKLARYHGEKTDDLFWAWAATWTSPGFRSWNIEHYLPKIMCPTLIIQGEEDDYGTLQQVERIIHGCSGPTEKCVVPSVGHNPHKEAPDIILEASSQFLLSHIG